MHCAKPIIFLLSLFLISCAENKQSEINLQTLSTVSSVEIPNRIVRKSLLNYNNKKSIWLLNDKLYSGFIVSFYPDSSLKEKTGIYEGKRQNLALKWFPDGRVKQVANYHKGKLHGEKKLWSPDTSHILITHLNYYLGKVHGEQKQWYPSGELYKKLNLNLGKEEGMQQAFRKNGELYANYEAKNGRIFGLKKSALCYGLEDGKVKYEE